MHIRRPFGALVASLALVLLAGGSVQAQEPPIDFDARGGIGFPVGSLGDVADVGPAFNVGFNFGITDRFLARVSGGAEFYDGPDLGEPLGREGVNTLEFDLIHFQAGGLYYLLEREGSPFFVTLEGTAGVTNFNVPRIATSVGTDAIEFELSELYFSAGGGVNLGYAVHEQVDVFVDGHSFVVFADEGDTAELIRAVNDVRDDPVDDLGTLWSIPVTAGVRLHF